jgi:flagellar biosynthesis protein FliR
MLLLDVAFAVLGRLQTQLQLLSLSFSIKMLLALSFLTGILSFFPAVFAKSGTVTFQTLLRLLSH